MSTIWLCIIFAIYLVANITIYWMDIDIYYGCFDPIRDEWWNISKEKRSFLNALRIIPFILLSIVLFVLVVVLSPLLLLFWLYMERKEEPTYDICFRRARKYSSIISKRKFFNTIRKEGFSPYPNQIIYIENRRNERLNDFFDKNYDEINNLFRTSGYPLSLSLAHLKY